MELGQGRTEGRVRITERDRLCGEFVVEQGFATIEQLWRVAWGDQKSASYVYDRVLALERSGFLKPVKVDGVSFKIVSPTAKFRQLVASFSQHPTPLMNASKDIVFHQLELNELRILFQEKGLTNWRSAECLAVDPSFKKIGTRHVPDAFYVTSSGTRTAIEYDRTLRKKDRIKDRLSSYVVELMSPDRNIDRLIYLVAPAYLKTYQQIFDQSFGGIKGKFVLKTMDEFKKELAGV
jgi:hypothetical protein